MIIDLQKLDEVKSQFTDLGLAVGDLSSQNDLYFEKLLASTEQLNEMMKSLLSPAQVDELSSRVDLIADQFDKVDEIVGNMENSFGDVSGLNQDLDKMSAKFDKLSGEVNSLKTESQAKTQKDVLASRKKKKKQPGYLSKELSGVSSKFKGFLNTLKVPVLGGVAAGIVSILAYGVMERQRLNAESGEVADIAVTAIDGQVKKLKGHATRWVSGFQETLQKFNGIAKEEVQAILKTFSDGGIAIAEWKKGYDKDLGQVGQNIFSFTMGVDKLLNVAGGTSAAKMVDYAERYGMSLEESKETLTRILEQGVSEDGLGFNKFTKMVDELSPAFEKLGFNVDNTVSFLAGMQEHFDNLKIPKHLAGNLMVKGAAKMADGIAGMSENWMRVIAERMNMGQGVAAVQQFRETWTRILKTKDDPNAYDNFLTDMVGIVLDLFEGDENRAKYLLEKEMGMGTEGAYIAMEQYKASKARGGRPASKSEVKAMKKTQKALKKSLQTEAEKKTAWERSMNKWMKGISKIGMGLMGLTAHTLAKLIMYFRLLPAYFSTFFDTEGGSAKRAELSRIIDSSLGSTQKATDQILAGIRDVQAGGKGMLGTLGPAIDNVVDAFSKEIPTMPSATPDRDKARSNMSAMVGSVQAPSTVKVVKVPVQAGSSSAIDTQALKKMPQANDAANNLGFWGNLASSGNNSANSPSEWVGKKPMKLINFGTDGRGDMQIGLVGECPRCGLDFDSGFDEKEFKSTMADASKNNEALLRMLHTEGTNDRVFQKGGKEELAAIMHTVRNRQKGRERAGKDSSEYDIITGGNGWGKQGNKRAYGTSGQAMDKKERAALQSLINDVDAGAYDSLNKGQTSFLHNTKGAGYGGKDSSGGGKWIADFANKDKSSSSKNVLNLDHSGNKGGMRTRFYSSSRKAKDSEHRTRLDQNYKDNFNMVRENEKQEKHNAGTQGSYSQYSDLPTSGGK